MNKLLISLLFLTGLTFSFTVKTSPVFSHEGRPHCREKDKSKCDMNSQSTKDNKKENHEGHNQS